MHPSPIAIRFTNDRSTAFCYVCQMSSSPEERSPLLYSEIADWWPVMSPLQDYGEEAGIFRDTLLTHARSAIHTLLELGAGGGHNAFHLKSRFKLTLTDLSPQMLAMSQQINGECEHVQGDMRSLDLGREFDAVFIHDAIDYMTRTVDLRAAMKTAFDHCRPGGIALFVPDDTRETWQPRTDHGGHDLGDRAMRYLEWEFDADPSDTVTQCIYTFVLREPGQPIRYLTDEHQHGLFPRGTWLDLMGSVGFEPKRVPYRHSEFTQPREMFLGLKPP